MNPMFRSVRSLPSAVWQRPLGKPAGTTAMGLKAFRMARGLSADNVADALGLRRGVIEQIEQGTTPTPLNVLAHLRDVLGADLNEIIGVSVPLGRLKANMPGFGGQVTFGFIDKIGGLEAVCRIVKPVRGKLRKQSIQNWHKKRCVPHYAIRQILAYAAENGIALTHEDFKPRRLWRDGSTSWPEPTLALRPSAEQDAAGGTRSLAPGLEARALKAIQRDYLTFDEACDYARRCGETVSVALPEACPAKDEEPTREELGLEPAGFIDLDAARQNAREFKASQNPRPMPGTGLVLAFAFALIFWAVVATGLSVAVLRQGAAPETPPSTQDLM